LYALVSESTPSTGSQPPDKLPKPDFLTSHEGLNSPAHFCLQPDSITRMTTAASKQISIDNEQ
jgi:hypothetical protein